jgi:hypothetical protein
MAVLKLVLRALWSTACAMLLIEGSAVAFLIAWYLVREGMDDYAIAHLRETFLVGNEFLAPMCFLFLMERATRKGGETTAKKPQAAAPATSTERVEPSLGDSDDVTDDTTQTPQSYVVQDASPMAAASVGAAGVATAAVAAVADVPAQEMPSMRDFEPADHEPVLNPADGMPMLDGYGSVDIDGHSYGEADAPAQMPLFN